LLSEKRHNPIRLLFPDELSPPGSQIHIAQWLPVFTGCGNSESQSGDGTNTGSGDQVVVDIFQNKNEISDALQAAIEQ